VPRLSFLFHNSPDAPVGGEPRTVRRDARPRSPLILALKFSGQRSAAPDVLGRVGPQGEPERRLGQGREDRARVLAGLQRLPLGQCGQGGLTLAFEAEREDLDAPEA